MHVDEAIRTRRSIRQYANRTVEESLIRKVLEAGRLAPSASNRQEWRYIVVQYPHRRFELSEAANHQAFVAAAPVVIVCCAETDGHHMRCGEPCYPIDVSISMDHMALQAWSLGLGTCWIGAFDAPQVKQLLKIPESIRVVELMTLGYPEQIPKPTPRKALDEIVRWEYWEKSS